MKSKQIEDMILGLSTEDFSSLEEYRKAVIKLTRQLSSKLKEGAEEVLDEGSLRNYINKLVQASYLKLDRLPSVPIDLKVKERSKAYRNIFKEELSKYEYQYHPRLVKISTSSILASQSISELRAALRLWQEAKRVSDKIAELEGHVELLDLQVTFDTKNEDLLEFYIQQNRELTEALTKDDEEYLLAKKVHRLGNEGKGRPTIAKALGISEGKVRSLWERYKFEE